VAIRGSIPTTRCSSSSATASPWPIACPSIPSKCLTDADLVAVLSFIKSTWPAELRASHDRVNVMYGPYNRAVGELIGAGGG